MEKREIYQTLGKILAVIDHVVELSPSMVTLYAERPMHRFAELHGKHHSEIRKNKPAEKLLAELLDSLNMDEVGALPDHAPLECQGYVLLGYHATLDL